MHDSRAVANELIALADKDDRTLTPMQIIKLVYICHGWMLGLYDRPLVRQLPEAWKYGPVFRELYRDLKKYGGGAVTGAIPDRSEEFDAVEQNLIRQVYEKYGHSSGIALSNMTHTSDSPWAVTWRAYESGPISNDLITEYYKRLSRERSSTADRTR